MILILNKKDCYNLKVNKTVENSSFYCCFFNYKK